MTVERRQARPSAAKVMILYYMWFFKVVLIADCYMDLWQIVFCTKIWNIEIRN